MSLRDGEDLPRADASGVHSYGLEGHSDPLATGARWISTIRPAELRIVDVSSSSRTSTHNKNLGRVMIGPDADSVPQIRASGRCIGGEVGSGQEGDVDLTQINEAGG